jgi:hypothetical protein
LGAAPGLVPPVPLNITEENEELRGLCGLLSPCSAVAGLSWKEQLQPRNTRNTRSDRGSIILLLSRSFFVCSVYFVVSNAVFQQSLSVSICVHSPRCRAVAAGPWLTLLPLVFRLEVLIFLGKKTAGRGRRRALFRGMPNRSMVPCQVHGGTILLPVCPEPATCPSHYCECLYCPDVSETRLPRLP